MTNEEEENKKKDEEKKKLDQLNGFQGEKLQKPELTPEQQEERLLISGMLFKQTEQFTEEELKRKRKRQKEIFESRIVELADGRQFTIKELHSLVVGIRQAYVSLFDNTTDFFSQVYRLCGIQGDPKKYTKPYKVSRIIRRIIYARFQVEVLPALEFFNPVVLGGFRRYKLSQYLNDEGKKKIIEFRKQAEEMMKTYPDLDWYRFEKAYCKKYDLPFHRSLFDTED
ncbi:P63C domain-containing protein [Larkinella humicola]|uniref:Bacteriophage Mx8 p63 C-terminal domain-containing protein n=1 Tax=Larkinella humicola TaxID=2607654 RepID=A0A5N1J3N9_9BACT|nr:P63C domain-containing protein [Larkinella humicola]KAA9341152.1 hypothetical protein F0P93_30420 [Larkinella humicola]